MTTMALWTISCDVSDVPIEHLLYLGLGPKRVLCCRLLLTAFSLLVLLIAPFVDCEWASWYECIAVFDANEKRQAKFALMHVN